MSLLIYSIHVFPRPHIKLPLSPSAHPLLNFLNSNVWVAQFASKALWPAAPARRFASVGPFFFFLIGSRNFAPVLFNFVQDLSQKFISGRTWKKNTQKKRLWNVKFAKLALFRVCRLNWKRVEPTPDLTAPLPLSLSYTAFHKRWTITRYISPLSF